MSGPLLLCCWGPLYLCRTEQGSGCIGYIDKCNLIFGKGRYFGALGVGKIGLGIEYIGGSSEANLKLAFFGFEEPACEDGVLTVCQDTLPVCLKAVDSVEYIQFDAGLLIFLSCQPLPALVHGGREPACGGPVAERDKKLEAQTVILEIFVGE